MKHMKMNLPLILIALTVILIPSIASVSSQSNDTLSGDTSADNTLSNDTFSSWSRDFANNQTGSDDDSDQEAVD